MGKETIYEVRMVSMRLYDVNRYLVDASRCYSDTFTPHIKSRLIRAFKCHNSGEDEDYEISFSLRLFRKMAWSRVIVNFDTHEICFLSDIIRNSYHKHTKRFLDRRKYTYIYDYKPFKNDKFEDIYDARYILIKSKSIIWKLGWVVNE